MKATAKALLCILFSTVLLLSSCATGQVPSVQEAIGALCASEHPLPAGRLYLRHISNDPKAHTLSDRLLAELFGAGTLPPETDLLQDAALYLSYAEPIEYTVFLCKSRNDTLALVRLCQKRLDHLRQPYSSSDSEMPASLQHATVSVRGRWVILCISSDPDTAIRAFRRLF